MILYVTRDPNNTGELIPIHIEDVIYIGKLERTVILHTLDGEYYPLMPTLSTFEQHMKPYGFHRLDRTNLVNIDKVAGYDEKRSLVFFEETKAKSSKYGTVSNSMKRAVQRSLEERERG